MLGGIARTLTTSISGIRSIISDVSDMILLDYSERKIRMRQVRSTSS